MEPQYYNTTQLEGKELLEAKEKAISQDAKVLYWCRSLRIFSASKIWMRKNHIIHSTTFEQLKKIEPLVSVRRALNTLERNGYIQKIEEDGKVIRVKGLYNSTESLYQLT